MDRTQETARILFDDWNAKTPYRAMSGANAIRSVEEAYLVQSELQKLHAKTRGRIAGRKIALASKAMQQMVGMDRPIAAAMFADDVVMSPATIRAGDFVRLGLEFELAVELNADIPPQATAHSARTAQGFVASVRPAFELIEDRKADYAALDPHTIIADNGWCGGVVLGTPLANWAELDLGDIPSTVSQAGEPDEETNTGAADPLASLAWVLNHFSERGITLSKGEHIITGSAVRTRFPVPGDSFTYTVAGATVQVSVI